jgi:hypothetical protein
VRGIVLCRVELLNTPAKPPELTGDEVGDFAFPAALRQREFGLACLAA